MTVTTSAEANNPVSQPSAAQAPVAAPASKVRKAAASKSAAAPVTEAVRKTGVKAKQAATAKAKPAATAKVKAAVDKPPKALTVKAEKADKNIKVKKVSVKKPKLIRDSFTFPEADYALIGALKQRALKAGHEVKKSELLRAGLTVLSGFTDGALLKVLTGVDKLKTGRPSN